MGPIKRDKYVSYYTSTKLRLFIQDHLLGDNKSVARYNQTVFQTRCLEIHVSNVLFAYCC